MRNNLNLKKQISTFQLVLKSSSKNSLFIYINFLKRILFTLKFNNVTFFSLPKTIKRITLLKSPHVNKKAKEQFEVIHYKILISFKSIDISNNLIKYLLLNKPKSINIKLKS